MDVHAWARGRPLVLAGLKVPHEFGLAGHSDGDVVIHALIDAMLGAIAMGDIGTFFPSEDERWRGADSRVLLREIAARALATGWQLNNADITVVAERPRLAPFMPAMRQSLAECLGVPVSRVSVKATTTDGLGFTGRHEGVAALAIATMVRQESA